jgi:hypothetical protein
MYNGQDRLNKIRRRVDKRQSLARCFRGVRISEGGNEDYRDAIVDVSLVSVRMTLTMQMN